MQKTTDAGVKLAVAMLGIVLLAGCGTTYHIQTDANGDDATHPRYLALFLDGTANDLDSETNVAKLSHIVKNQNKPNLHVFYNEGVGTGLRPVGAMTGWGAGKDVVEAYAFLSKFHRPGSKLYIFGFSRGAYSSRILAGMIYSVGIYDLSGFPKEKRLKISKELYKKYKSEKKKDCNQLQDWQGRCEQDDAQDVRNIRNGASDIVGKYGLDKNAPDYAEIDLLGLWDTVEALGVVQTAQAILRNLFGIKEDVNVVNPNHHYIDQVCNVKKVLHALSLDDNRQYVFTPISIRSPYVVKRCKDKSLDKVKEVWFSGAHADVGGGYSISDQLEQGGVEYRDIALAGNSLNWMMAEIMADKNVSGLLPAQASVSANALAYSHDAEGAGLLYRISFERSTRREVMESFCRQVYGARVDEEGRVVAGDCVGKQAFTLHPSVLQRLQRFGPVRKYDSGRGVFRDNGFDSQWYLSELFDGCFDAVGSGYGFNASCSRLKQMQ